MLRRIGILAAVVVFSVVFRPLANAQSYTLDQLTQNNTAACSAPNYGLVPGHPYCEETFPGNAWAFNGWDDNEWCLSNFCAQQYAAPIITAIQDPSPAGTYNSATNSWSLVWNVSKGRYTSDCCDVPAPTDMHRLMYGNGTGSINTKVIVELQSWFCDSVQGFNYKDGDAVCNATLPNWVPEYQNPTSQTILQYESHGDVGYVNWYQDTQNARALDIWDRGGDVTAWDWYGQPNDCPLPCTTNSCTYNYQLYFNQACPGHFQQEDLGWQDMVSAMQSFLPTQRPGANMQFFLMLDHNSWTSPTVCGANDLNGDTNYGAYEPQCALDKTIVDLKQAIQSGGFLAQPNYFKVGGLPVIAIFQNEGSDPPTSYAGSDFSQCGTTDAPTCYYDDNEDQCDSAGACYDGMYQQLRAWLDNSSGLGKNQYYLIFARQSGCPGGSNSHPSSDGCYYWVTPHGNDYDPGLVTITNQEYAGQPPQQAAQGFYTNSTNLSYGTNGKPPLVIGGVYKGFDDYMAQWWADRILTQGCATTWLTSWSDMNVAYSPSNPLNYVMVETWDDYEEGTEIETGIDNCLEQNTFTTGLSGPGNSTLTWNFSFAQPQNVPFNPNVTIDHYGLFYSTSLNGQLSLQANIPNTSQYCTFVDTTQVESCSINLENYSWTSDTQYYLYIQAVGKPTVANYMSPPQPYTP